MLNSVKQSAFESETIGNSTLEALSSQHEVLLRANEKVDEVKTNSNIARSVLRVRFSNVVRDL